MAFVAPLTGAHARLEAQKERLQDATEQRIRGLLDDLDRDVDARDLEQADAYNRTLATLLVERDILAKLPTWPWSTATLRTFFTTILLPLTLFLLQQVLSRLLQAPGDLRRGASAATGPSRAYLALQTSTWNCCRCAFRTAAIIGLKILQLPGYDLTGSACPPNSPRSTSARSSSRTSTRHSIRSRASCTTTTTWSTQSGSRRWVNHVNADERVGVTWDYLIVSESDIDMAKGSWAALKRLG